MENVSFDYLAFLHRLLLRYKMQLHVCGSRMVWQPWICTSLTPSDKNPPPKIATQYFFMNKREHKMIQ